MSESAAGDVLAAPKNEANLQQALAQLGAVPPLG